MKTLITLCFVVVFAFSGKGQTLSFEETLAYLNKTLKEETGTIKYGGMSAGSSSGDPDINSTVEMTSYLKDALRSFGTVGYLKAIEVTKKGIYSMVLDDDFPRTFNLFKLNQGFLLVGNHIVFSKAKREITFLQFATDKEAARFYKALQHLNTFLSVEKDPFDN